MNQIQNGDSDHDLYQKCNFSLELYRDLGSLEVSFNKSDILPEVTCVSLRHDSAVGVIVEESVISRCRIFIDLGNI